MTRQGYLDLLNAARALLADADDREETTDDGYDLPDWEALRKAINDVDQFDDGVSADVDRQSVIRAARDLYETGSDNDIEIDDNCDLSGTDDGTWVQAWVWVNHEELAAKEPA